MIDIVRSTLEVEGQSSPCLEVITSGNINPS